MLDHSFIATGSPDYWYDVGVTHAIAALADLSASDWDGLHASWRQQDVEWQERLAYALGGSDSRREASLLLQMYRDGCEDVRLTAAESLHGLPVQTVVSAFAESDFSRMHSTVGVLKTTHSILEWLSRPKS